MAILIALAIAGFIALMTEGEVTWWNVAAFLCLAAAFWLYDRWRQPRDGYRCS